MTLRGRGGLTKSDFLSAIRGYESFRQLPESIEQLLLLMHADSAGDP